MKIKRQLIYSYIIIIIVVTFIEISLSFAFLKQISMKYKSIKLSVKEQILNDNKDLSKKILSQYGESIVDMEAQNAISKLKLLFENIDIANIESLRENTEIVAIASKHILSLDGSNAGYLAMLDKKGKMLIHPNKELEGKNLSEWKDKFPEMWSLIHRSFTEKKVKGYYSFFDEKTNFSKDKFMVLRHIPDSDFVITATVYIENYYAFVHEKIAISSLDNEEKSNKNFEEIKHLFLFKNTISIIIIIIFLLLLGYMLSLIFSLKISKPINALKISAEKMQKGNFTKVKAKSVEEIQDLIVSFNKLSDLMKKLVNQVQSSGIQLLSTSTEISATARLQTRTITDFKESTSEVAVATIQISETSQELSATISKVTDIVSSTSEVADQGLTNISQMKITMLTLKKATKSISEKLKIINNNTRNITSIISTITKIADRTNLLSLNASIEAKKAGKFGSGFSVVAKEIRHLADQTSGASLDIESVVKDMNLAVSSGVDEMDVFTEKVQRGVHKVHSISKQLNEIIQLTQKILPDFNKVYEGMLDQTAGAEMISKAITQLNESALKTSESISEFNKATEQLNIAAHGLQEEVQHFSSK